ncbi:hypothetical protein OSB04_006820, partial [Centaurea solstitialis]
MCVTITEYVFNTIPKNIYVVSKYKISVGGRLSLCKAVLGGLGGYYFSLFKAPSNVIKDLERKRRNFLWGSSNEHRKTAWVTWDKVLNSREKGGFGIGSLRAHNIALLAKWWWRFKTEEKALWRQVIVAFYGRSGRLGEENGGLSKRGAWGSIATVDRGRRRLMEGGSNDPHKLLKARRLATLWNKLIPLKVRVRNWLARLDRLPTKFNLGKRGIRLDNDQCVFCNEDIETSDHIFLSCRRSIEVRRAVNSWWDLLPLQSFSMQNFYDDGKGDRVLSRRKIKEVAAQAYIWALWNGRNEAIFNNKVLDPLRMTNDIKSHMFNWCKARDDRFRLLNWNIWC